MCEKKVTPPTSGYMSELDIRLERVAGGKPAWDHVQELLLPKGENALMDVVILNFSPHYMPFQCSSKLGEHDFLASLTYI